MSLVMKKKTVIIIIAVVVVLLISVAEAFIAGIQAACYQAQDVALEALVSDDEVSVTATEDYIFFDGSGTDKALVFYPGAFVDADAYAPLMRELAASGTDCFVVWMPFDFALLNTKKADAIMDSFGYDSWYLGGHSLGGVAAGNFCSNNLDRIDGLLLLGSYSVDPVNTKEDFKVVSLYGTLDTVLDHEAMKESRGNLPAEITEVEIQGGNHAQFGDYGFQEGDSEATITAAEQIQIVVDAWNEAV